MFLGATGKLSRAIWLLLASEDGDARALIGIALDDSPRSVATVRTRK